jgi:hypothetical protein
MIATWGPARHRVLRANGEIEARFSVSPKRDRRIRRRGTAERTRTNGVATRVGVARPQGRSPRRRGHERSMLRADVSCYEWMKSMRSSRGVPGEDVGQRRGLASSKAATANTAGGWSPAARTHPRHAGCLGSEQRHCLTTLLHSRRCKGKRITRLYKRSGPQYIHKTLYLLHAQFRARSSTVTTGIVQVKGCGRS